MRDAQNFALAIIDDSIAKKGRIGASEAQPNDWQLLTDAIRVRELLDQRNGAFEALRNAFAFCGDSPKIYS